MGDTVCRHVNIVDRDFDLAAEYAALCRGGPGAVVLFAGLARDFGAAGPVTALTLEHFSGMAEARIDAIISEAADRWPLLQVRVIHRVGRIKAGEQIVLTGVASQHREHAFAACQFIMDFLKTEAPIWKKEHGDGKAHWVAPHGKDAAARARWHRAQE